jgi:hypothetical protein
MHNLFLVHFVNLYMLPAYLGPSSGGTTRTTDSLLKRIISTNCCIHTVVPPDDGPRYARNMKSLTKYTKNKLYIKLVFLCTIIFEMHGQQNTKFFHFPESTTVVLIVSRIALQIYRRKTAVRSPSSAAVSKVFTNKSVPHCCVL